MVQQPNYQKHKELATAAAYDHLATVVAAVVTDATGVACLLTTPPAGNAEVQVTTGDAATATEGNALDVTIANY